MDAMIQSYIQGCEMKYIDSSEVIKVKRSRYEHVHGEANKDEEPMNNLKRKNTF